MDLGTPEIGIFASLLVVLALALIALAADLLQGNVEVLREEVVHLRSREDGGQSLLSVPGINHRTAGTHTGPPLEPEPESEHSADSSSEGVSPVLFADAAPSAASPASQEAEARAREVTLPASGTGVSLNGLSCPESAAPVVEPEATSQTSAEGTEVLLPPVPLDRRSTFIPPTKPDSAPSAQEESGSVSPDTVEPHTPDSLPITEEAGGVGAEPAEFSIPEFPPDAPRAGGQLVGSPHVESAVGGQSPGRRRRRTSTLPYRIWCERCESTDIHVSRRQNPILHLLGFVAHRCLTCSRRFYRYPGPLSQFKRIGDPVMSRSNPTEEDSDV
jgi:hypothetical protein